jgi:hypothetical protein
MNRTLLSLVVTALFAGAGNAALAQQGTQGSTAASRSAYTAARNNAQSTYTKATAKCEAAPGATTAVCLSDALAARTKSLDDAQAAYEGGGASMTSEGVPLNSARADDTPVVNSGTADRNRSSAERLQPTGQPTTSIDTEVVRAGGEANLPQREGNTPAGTVDNERSGPEASVTSRNEEGVQGDSPSNDNSSAQSDQRNDSATTTSGNRADRNATGAAAQARYKQAMAKCDAAPGETRFTCREAAEQARRGASAQSRRNGDTDGRRGRTGRDDLSSTDDSDYQNVSTARGDAR